MQSPPPHPGILKGQHVETISDSSIYKTVGSGPERKALRERHRFPELQMHRGAGTACRTECDTVSERLDLKQRRLLRVARTNDVSDAELHENNTPYQARVRLKKA